MWDFIHTNNNLYSILSVTNGLYAVYRFSVVYLYMMSRIIIVYCLCICVMLCMFICSVSVYYLSTVCCYVFLWHHYNYKPSPSFCSYVCVKAQPIILLNWRSARPLVMPEAYSGETSCLYVLYTVKNRVLP